jgi:hypothetical protein
MATAALPVAAILHGTSGVPLAGAIMVGVAGVILGMALAVFLTMGVGLRLVRQQRHRYFNQLQVIAGWLQLNRAEPAGRYLDTLMADAATMQWLTGRPLWYQWWVWWLDAYAEGWAVRLHWKVTSDPVRRTEAVRLALAVQILLKRLKRSGQGTLTVEASPDSFRIVVSECPCPDGLPFVIAGARRFALEDGLAFLWPPKRPETLEAVGSG